MIKNLFVLQIAHMIIFFATPKKRTSKSKSKSRFSHWLKKPEKILKQMLSSGQAVKVNSSKEGPKKSSPSVDSKRED